MGERGSEREREGEREGERGREIDRERQRKEHKGLYNLSSDVRVVNENCGVVGIGLSWETQFFLAQNPL